MRPVLTVRHASGDCPVYLGRGVAARLPWLLARHLPGARRAVVVGERRLASSLVAPLVAGLRQQGFESAPLLLPSGERVKSLAVVERLWGRFLALGVERRTPVVVVGGGALGDAAGFAAATYLRGVPLVQVPTTLLAQADSGIGGKTAVNHPRAKNLIGAFHPPAFVLCDVDLLRTLSARQLRAGLAEVVKVALVFEPGFARWLDRNWRRLMAGDTQALARAVRTALSWKARVVSRDERDLAGARELLNFGHTVGHALEAVAGGRLGHGEAVAWGLEVALELSRARGWLAEPEERALAGRLVGALEPPAPGPLPGRALLAALEADKKRREGRAVFVLLQRLGRARRVDDVPWSLLRRVLREKGLGAAGA